MVYINLKSNSPLIGGTFEHPADHWPDLFTNPVWSTYPYLLPCLLSSAASLGGTLLAIFILPEVRPTLSRDTQTSLNCNYYSIPDIRPFQVNRSSNHRPLSPAKEPQKLRGLSHQPRP